MQLLPVPGEHRAVDDLPYPGLGEAMEVALGFADRHGAQLIERAIDVDLGAVDGPDDRDVEGASNDRGGVEDATRGRRDAVHAAQQQQRERARERWPLA